MQRHANLQTSKQGTAKPTALAWDAEPNCAGYTRACSSTTASCSTTTLCRWRSSTSRPAGPGRRMVRRTLAMVGARGPLLAQRKGALPHHPKRRSAVFRGKLSTECRQDEHQDSHQVTKPFACEGRDPQPGREKHRRGSGGSPGGEEETPRKSRGRVSVATLAALPKGGASSRSKSRSSRRVKRQSVRAVAVAAFGAAKNAPADATAPPLALLLSRVR